VHGGKWSSPAPVSHIRVSEDDERRNYSILEKDYGQNNRSDDNRFDSLGDGKLCIKKPAP